MIWNRTWREEALAVGLAALMTVVLLTLAYHRVWPLSIPVGENDSRFAVDFNAPESIGGRVVRWTNGASRVLVPRPPDGTPAVLSMRAVNGRPDGQPTPQATLRIDGKTLPPFPITRAVNGVREYRILVESSTRLSWDLPVEFDSDTIVPPQDPRPLGFMLDSLTWTPLRSGLPLPSLWLGVWAVLLGAWGYSFPRSFGMSRGRALIATLIVAVLVAVDIVLRPLEVLPFVQRIGALFGLGTAAVLLARFLAPTIGHDDTEERDETGTPALHGRHAPVYLAVASWMGAWFELILTADGVDGVTPSPFTMWIGGALVLALAAMSCWALLRRNQLQLTRGALLVFAVAAVAHLVAMIWFAYTRSGPDFWILFKGARDWARGGSLYDLQAIHADHFGHVFKVPPFYGMLFVPFVFQDGTQILLYHRILNTVLLAITVLVWFRMWNIRVLTAMGAGVLMLINFRAFTDTMAFGQIDLALLLILTLALWALRGGHDGVAGALVALGTLFKIYPVLLLGFFVAKRQWRALAGFVVGMIVFNGISMAVMGWEIHRAYLLDVLPNIGGTTSWVENQTIGGFLARLVDTPTEAGVLANRSIALLANAISLVVIAAACVLALRPAQRDTTTFALQYGLFLLVMVLAIPAAWMHYETLLFVPFAVLLLHWRNRAVPLTRVVVLAVSFGLIVYGNQWSYYTGTVMGMLTILAISSKFYGMLLLGGVLTRTLLDEGVPVPARAVRWLPRYALRSH
jgi:hypothetical protein